MHQVFFKNKNPALLERPEFLIKKYGTTLLQKQATECRFLNFKKKNAKGKEKNRKNVKNLQLLY